MAKQVQQRRGTTAEHNSFTGAVGELTVDTSKDTVVVHDGSTSGGHPLQKEIADNGLSGNKIDGGMISNFTSTGINDDATSVALTIDADENVTVNTGSFTVHKAATAEAGSINVSSADSTLRLKSTTSGTDAKTMEMRVAAGKFRLRNINDANTVVTERLVIDNTSGVFTYNGVDTAYAGGSANLNTTFSHTFVLTGIRTACIVTCGISHGSGEYHTFRQTFLAGYSLALEELDVFVKNTANGGSWSFEKDGNYALTVTHNAGVAANTAKYFIKVESAL
jgi:hypothetical protein